VIPSRGAVYTLRDYGNNGAFLILTNDIWNLRMASAGGVLVTRSGDLDPLAVPLNVIGAFANPSLLMALPHERLEPSAIYSLDPAELRSVEVSLAAVLRLGTASKTTPLPVGQVNYPVWGQIYYGPKIAGQVKRFVVVSNDQHNRVTKRPCVVRLTSRQKTDSTSFRAVSGNKSRAFCGDLTFLPQEHLHFHPFDRRPVPDHLQPFDMGRIANGIRQTHCL
jgi:hypothetical protein